MNELLRVEGLKKSYGDVQAVNGISFSVRAGEIVALLGPNGAGKTTTIDIIVGLRRKDQGLLTYFGDVREAITLADKERIGVQLQHTVFFPELTVREILLFLGALYKKRLPFAQLITYFSLEEQQHKRLKHLSGGQKQRLALACAFINDPELIFLDEPTSGIDAQNRQALWNIIGNLRSQGKGIILTTHYIEEAERLADRVILIDKGHITADGSVEKLKGSYGKATLEEVFLALTGSALRD